MKFHLDNLQRMEPVDFGDHDLVLSLLSQQLFYGLPCSLAHSFMSIQDE